MSDINEQEEAVAESEPGSGSQQSRAQAVQPPENAPAVAEKKEPQVILHLTEPPFTDAFEVAIEGTTHRITRVGSSVPASVADAVIKAAQDHDVTVEKQED